jgi:pyrroloquinoline quinone biosynthesis protein B
MSKIPHPTIEESLMRLQKKESNDIKVKFIHFNHTNPVCDERSEERKQIESMGWGVGQRGDVVKL